MACFIVPAAEAVVTTIAAQSAKKSEKAPKISDANTQISQTEEKIPFSRKLRWLTNLLFGGAILLAFEHVWHGEVVPYFPFLTAAANSADAAEMLHEMATTGVTMAALVTVVWVGMLIVSAIMEKKNLAQTKAVKSN